MKGNPFRGARRTTRRLDRMNIWLRVAIFAGAIWFWTCGRRLVARKFPKPVWEYPADASWQTLHRHHRWAMWIVYTCYFSIIGMVSAIIQLLVFRASSWVMFTTGAFCILLALSIVPAIIAGAWTGEIARVCHERGIPVPRHPDIRERVRANAVALLLWILLAVLSPWIVRLALACKI